MELTQATYALLEGARDEAKAAIDRIHDDLLQKLEAGEPEDGTITFAQPTDENCRDHRVKAGKNLSPDGVEILFRLLDAGAGYNSAGRRLSITQSAVKNRKADWLKSGGTQRAMRFISWLDTRA